MTTIYLEEDEHEFRLVISSSNGIIITVGTFLITVGRREAILKQLRRIIEAYEFDKKFHPCVEESLCCRCQKLFKSQNDKENICDDCIVELLLGRKTLAWITT